MRKDNHRHQGLRSQLVQELIAKGIQDEDVLSAINTIPRHFFLDEAFAEWAYTDKAFQIGSGQTISQPYTVAKQTELLEVKNTDKILEIGTGSGYQACVLAYLGCKLYTIERQEELFHKTSILLKTMNFNQIRTLFGDGYLGSERFAPFDKIIITAGATSVPQVLFNQLKIGGIMVIPVGDNNTQRMLRIKKISNTSYIEEDHGNFAFVPFVAGTNALTTV